MEKKKRIAHMRSGAIKSDFLGDIIKDMDITYSENMKDYNEKVEHQKESFVRKENKPKTLRQKSTNGEKKFPLMEKTHKNLKSMKHTHTPAVSKQRAHMGANNPKIHSAKIADKLKGYKIPKLNRSVDGQSPQQRTSVESRSDSTEYESMKKIKSIPQKRKQTVSAQEAKSDSSVIKIDKRINTKRLESSDSSSESSDLETFYKTHRPSKLRRKVESVPLKKTRATKRRIQKPVESSSEDESPGVDLPDLDSDSEESSHGNGKVCNARTTKSVETETRDSVASENLKLNRVEGDEVACDASAVKWAESTSLIEPCEDSGISSSEVQDRGSDNLNIEETQSVEECGMEEPGNARDLLERVKFEKEASVNSNCDDNISEPMDEKHDIKTESELPIKIEISSVASVSEADFFNSNGEEEDIQLIADFSGQPRTKRVLQTITLDDDDDIAILVEIKKEPYAATSRIESAVQTYPPSAKKQRKLSDNEMENSAKCDTVQVFKTEKILEISKTCPMSIDSLQNILQQVKEQEHAQVSDTRQVSQAIEPTQVSQAIEPRLVSLANGTNQKLPPTSSDNLRGVEPTEKLSSSAAPRSELQSTHNLSNAIKTEPCSSVFYTDIVPKRPSETATSTVAGRSSSHCNSLTGPLQRVSDALLDFARQKKSVCPLLNLYKKEMESYQILHRLEHKSEGLMKMLHQQKAKLEHLEQSIRFLMKDPCMLKIIQMVSFGSASQPLVKHDQAAKPTAEDQKRKQIQATITSKMCFHCKINCRKPFVCSLCAKALYCSAECQKSDWINGHKNTCKK